ncbi:LysR family transcriptional regulator [Vibrio rhizosphaerae]|uniref:LysR family transcriptional regulator n=1 Tax=Vibrio rhizosphaerae TaxID=398736 RepID=UPI000690AFE4|nr:LysR family transcriptional regulator [Vibrio rhizosphaerae]
MNHYPSSEQLFLFSTVVDQGSFSKAAAHMGVHVSTVTRQIDQLEQRIKAKLLIRSSRFLGLTEAGRYLYEKSKPLLKDLTDTMETIRAIESSTSGVIRMSCLPTFGKMIVIPFLAQCRRQEINLDIHLNLTERLVDPIVERLDLAIRIGEQPDSSLYPQKIGTQTWHICASPQLLARYSAEQIGQFNHLPLIDKCAEYNSLCWKGLEKSNVIAARCDDFHAQLMLAMAGIGVCCLPNWVVAPAIAAGELVKVMDDPFDRCETIYALRPFQQASAKVSLAMAGIETALITISGTMSADSQ